MSYADLGDIRLHYVEEGDGPLVVLLHGFPEFWYSWRRQLPLLARAGFRAVAPDMRGYNLSSKPSGVGAYDLGPLSEDIARLIRALGAEDAFLAGHDWGGGVAWATAMHHPDVVRRLAILNMPHPRRYVHALRDPRQLAKSWYAGAFQLPWLPELGLRAGGWRALRYGFEHDARPGAFTPEDIDRYREAWEQPGALTAMLNYYRAATRRTPPLRPVAAPTRVIWGDRDRYLTRELAEPRPADVPQLERVIHLDASHWVQHDQPKTVADLLVEFFAA